VGYYDEYGNLIDDMRATRLNYLRRWDGLALDFVAAIPMELTMDVIHRNIMLYHLIRLIHIKRYFKSLQSKINIKYDVFRFYRATLCRVRSVNVSDMFHW